ncbi:hypothetical protein [Marinicellulosiphila megalodicopiae]|uniref:hypothetical protein n=1 Tax=Marinicellulosiphila megalodicopiae TaxID=2724896 RepID=UPI003BAEF1E7
MTHSMIKVSMILCFVILASCSSSSKKSQDSTMGGAVSEPQQISVEQLQSEPNIANRVEEQSQDSAHLTYLKYLLDLETDINDQTLSDKYINSKSISRYIENRHIFADLNVFESSYYSEILLSKLKNSVENSDVWYFDTVKSLSLDYIETRFLIYHDNGNMSSMSIYLDKQNLTLLDVLLDDESFTLSDKFANAFYTYEKPVKNSKGYSVSTKTAPNYLAPIMIDYYPEEQNELATVLTNIQESKTPYELFNHYKKIDEKFKTKKLLEFIDVKVAATDWYVDWLNEKLAENTELTSAASVFFTFYYLNNDKFETFFKLSDTQSPYYKQSLTWHYYQLIAAKLSDNQTQVNESMYQILTRFGSYDFVYYMVALQFVRMDQLELAKIVEDAMQDRFDYALSTSDLMTTTHGEKYIQRYK